MQPSVPWRAALQSTRVERILGGHRRRACSGLFIAAEVALLFGDPEEMLALAGELEMAATGFDDAVHIALVEGAVAFDSSA